MIFSSCFVYAQKNPKYTVSDIPKTIIKTPLQFLNLKDTINKNRNIYPVSENFGGLNPRYPMALSYEQLNSPVIDFAEFVFKFNIFTGHCYNYLIEINDSIIEINSHEKFKEIFAPVENKEEALSFAYVLCGYPHVKAIYDFNFLNEKDTDYDIFRKELKPTSVKEVTVGYEVILFDTYSGFTAYCSELVIFVSTQGDVKLLKREKLFHDKNFNLIIN